MFVQRDPSLGDVDMVRCSLCSILLWLFMHFVYACLSRVGKKEFLKSGYIYAPQETLTFTTDTKKNLAKIK